MLYTAKEIRKIVREGIVRRDRFGVYSQARLAKQVLLFDPEYGELSGTTSYQNIDCNGFLIALQAMANALKVNIWEAARITKVARDIAVDEENCHFNMPPTREVIEALK